MNFGIEYRRRPRLLIVEDERLIARDLRGSLEELGYEVAGIVDSAADALASAREHRPDLILMDIRLRGDADGIDAAERIRADLALPFVYLTSHTDDVTLERAKVTDPYAYIVKPFTERELHGAVQVALHRAQQEAIASEQREWLAATLRSIGDAVAATDPSGVVKFLNPAAEELTGWCESDAVGRPIDEVVPLEPEDPGFPTIPHPLRDSLARRARIHPGDVFRLRSLQGVSIDVELSASPILDQPGDLRGGILVFRDISSRRLLHDQIVQVQKLEAVGRLAGGIAHDFNNLLTIILGTNDLILQELEDRGGSVQLAEQVRQSCLRAASLTQRLLALGQKQKLKSHLVDLNGIVTRLTEILGDVLDRSVAVLVDLAPGPVVTKADPVQLEQVLLNLILNARDAMPQGGTVTLQTSFRNPSRPGVASVEPEPGALAVVSVSDTGKGMGPEVVSRLFEPFFTTKDQSTGAGLGLAIAHGIVRQSGGNIEVQTKEGIGSVFSIVLPHHPGVPETKPEPRPRTSSDRPAGVTVLVAEDEPALRRLATSILRLDGCTVLEARDAVDALRIAHDHPGTISVLVTDVIMPRINGLELARKIRHWRPELRVLYMSGYTDELLPLHQLDPLSMFLAKPFTMTSLVEAVRSLAQREQSSALR